MKKRKEQESKELPGKNNCHYQIYIAIRVNIHIVIEDFKMLVPYLI